MRNYSMHMRAIANALLVMLAATLWACGDDAGPSGDAGADSGVDGGACSTGELDCACSPSGACSDGECVADMCTDCERGAAGCVCRSNGSCDEGVSCENEVCVACEPGAEGCPCDDGACQGELECTNDVCAPVGCAEGSVGCPCALDDSCDGELYCDDNTMCRECANDVAGCPCDDDSLCRGGLVCDDEQCRAAVTCADLADANACVEHQTCSEPANRDARCDDDCETGYVWNESAEACDACTDGECEEPPTCDPTAEGTIAFDCAARFELCVEHDDGAVCEGCVEGAIERDDRCIPITECGGEVCDEDEYCDGTTEECTELPCPAGEAQDGDEVCSSCNLACSAVGLSGRVWPFRTNVDTCVCETVAGYFMPSDQRAAPQLCDADLDGWVRQEADDETVRADDAFLDNSRCTILTIDGVKLRDELGSVREIRSCGDGEGLVPEDSAAPCTARNPLRLLEGERTDVPGQATGEAAPAYDHLASAGTGGRELQARELTALTKACVTANADYNDNGENDLIEQQTRPASVDDDDRTRLSSFAYFTELYRAYYEAPATAGTPGKLVIEERPRCELDAFFLTYWNEDDSFVEYAIDDVPVEPSASDRTATQRGDNYWRNCERRRDPRYSATNVGFDFAQWSCDATTGSCAGLPPAHPIEDATMFDYRDKVLRGHGACGVEGAEPADGIWRGFNHHSQFKCVQVDSGAGVVPPKYQPAAFGPTGTLNLNVCEATADSRPTHAGANTYEPVIECMPLEPVTNVNPMVRVAWAAVRYQTYEDASALDGSANAYHGGCIDEDTEWGEEWLCHDPLFSSDDDDAAAYGRYSCYGALQNFLWGDSDAVSAELYWDGVNSTNAMSVWR